MRSTHTPIKVTVDTSDVRTAFAAVSAVCDTIACTLAALAEDIRNAADQLALVDPQSDADPADPFAGKTLATDACPRCDHPVADHRFGEHRGPCSRCSCPGVPLAVLPDHETPT